LETIAEKVADAFYVGAIANATIKAIQATNGTMTIEDLSNYTATIRDPIQISYRDYKLTSCGAPSGGIVSLNVLKTVSGYTEFGSPEVVNLSTHRLDEAIRFGYGARANLGDPSFLPNMSTYQKTLLSNANAAKIRSMIIDTTTQNVSVYDNAGLESLETPGTSHVVTADSSGMAVTMTSTVNLHFGSLVMVPETGIILNDEMNDFSVPGQSNAFGYLPSPANFILPGKKPLSSISPVIVEFMANNTLYFVTGAAGGSKIITATIQSLWNVLDKNMTSAQAVKAPRFHDQLVPNQITFEYAYNNQTTAFMIAEGHNVTWAESTGADVQVIRRLPNGTFEAASEPRQADSGGFAV